MLTGILLAGVYSSDVVRAQPITIPALTTPAFNQTDFDPYFAAARQEQSIPAWQTLIEQAGIVLGSQWESQVDAQIAAELAGVTQSDAFNSPAEYRDYLRRELLVQKQNAFAGWELQAMAAIESERATFLAGLSSLDPSRAAADSDRAVDAGRASAAAGQQSATDAQSFDALAESVNQQANSWQDQFNEDYEAGLYQYSQALAGIEQNYNEFVQDLAQKDQEFQSNIAQIDAFENNVRTGIGAQLTALESDLLTNGVFHTETCDSENVCSLDPNTLNASGTQLQALITSMRAGLQNGASLSSLSNQMITYLQTSRAQAEADRQNWDSLSSATESLPVFGVALNGLRDPAVFSIPEVAAIDEYFLGAHSRIATITRQRSAQPSYRTITINSADARGQTPAGLLPIQIPIVSTVNRQGEWYSAVRRDALLWVHTLALPGGLGGVTDTVFAESELQIHINYTWHDTNAQANRDRWAGYVGNLDAMLAQWQNTILPAANTWETQKNSYAANYATWQTQAQAQQATALATTQQNRDLVIADRNRFISASEAAYRDGQNAWRDIVKDVSAARDAAGDLGATSQTIIDRIQQIGSAPGVGDNLSEIMRNLGGLPQPAQEVLNLTRTPLPDLQNLATVGNGLRTSLIGASNYSLTSATQESFERERDKVRKQLKKMLETSRLANSSSGDIAASLLMQRLEPAQAAQFQGMDSKEIASHINSTLGLAAGDTLTVNSVQIYAQLAGVEFEKPIHELIGARRADANDARWSVTEIDGGKLRATRQIKDGNAYLRFGGDATASDGYVAGHQEQVMEFAAPAVMRLADTDGLFEAWETSTILDNVDDQLNQFAVHTNEQRSAVWNAGSAADAFRNARDRQYKQNVQNQSFIASIIKAALTSAFSGGNAIEGASGVVRSRVMGPIYSALETATGIPAGIWGSLAGGADLEQAVISHGFSMLEQATGVPGIASLLQQEWGKMQARQARREAQRFRPEDMLPMGPISFGFSQLAYSSNPLVANYGRAMAGATSPTYAWRNAQHHDDGAVALQAVETVGAVAIQAVGTIIPGIGNAGASAIIAGYQATKQAYLGSLSGGTRGAVAGIASGVVGGLVKHYTGGFANVGFSYSYEDGFGVTAGGRVPFVELADGVGLSLGASAAWNEREGITHSGASLGFTAELGSEPGGPSLFAGLNYDSNRGLYANVGIEDTSSLGSGSAAVTYSPEEGYGAEINFGIDNEGVPDLLNGRGSLSYTENSGLSADFRTSDDSLDQLALNYSESDGITGTFNAPGGAVTYGPDGLSVQPNVEYWLDYMDALPEISELDISDLEIPELEIAGFNVGYDPDKGFTAVLPGAEEDVFAWNQTDGASSPYLESLEQQAEEQIDAIENAGGIVDQVEAIVGVVQNPGDFLDLDPFGGENPFEDLPDLAGIFGGGEDETDSGVEVAGGPDAGGEESGSGNGNGGESGPDGEGEDGELIAGGGGPDGGVAGHRGGSYTTPDGYHISSKRSKDQIEALNQRFGISESTVEKATETLAGCNAMAIPTEGSAREQALLAQIKCYAGIPAPPEGTLATGAPSLNQLGAQTYSKDFIDFVEAEENQTRVEACRNAGKTPQNCTVVKRKSYTIDSYRNSSDLKAQAEQLSRFENRATPDTIYVSGFMEERGDNGGGQNIASLNTRDHFANDWLQNSATGQLYSTLSEKAAEADLRRRQAERELFQLSMKDEAKTAMNATGFGNLSKTKKSDREKGLVESFAEEAYQLAVQMKNTVTNFIKDVAESAQEDFNSFLAGLDSFIADPFNAEKFFGFMKSTSDFGGNPAMIPVVSLPPAGQLFGRAFSVADLVTSMREGSVIGSVAALWGVLSGTKTGDLIEDYGAKQITKSKLVQNVTDAASEKLNKIKLAPCKTCEKCVVAGTPILTPSGNRPIESLRVGDTVIAYDTDAGETVERKITELHRDITIEWYDVRVGADTLTVTDNHPFWLPETGEWVPARDLKVGTVLQPKDGTAARISQINIRRLRQSEPIYNVEVEGEHNYFAGEGALLVHNGGGTNGKNCIACFSALWEKRFDEIWANIGDYNYGKNLSSTPGSRYGSTTAEKDVYEMLNKAGEPQDFVLGIYKGKSPQVNEILLKNNLKNLNSLHRRNLNGTFGVDIVDASAGKVAGKHALLMRRVEGVNTKGNLDLLKRDFTALKKNPFTKRNLEHIEKQLVSVRKFLEPDPNDVSKSVFVKDFQMMIDVKSGGVTIIDPGEVITGRSSSEALSDIDELLAALRR